MPNFFKSGDQKGNALTALRVVVGLLIFIHGVTRTYLGIVDDFGVFLNETGFPLGGILAWTITTIEIVGSLTMIAGRWVRPLAIYFAAELFTGIVLVHWSSGWFVVGMGSNGMEYSVLLISVLLSIAYSSGPIRKTGIDDE